MATVSGHIDASPDEVFAVLADGWLYTERHTQPRDS
jgi:hypothetical protein